MKEKYANRKANAVRTWKNADHFCRISPPCIAIKIIPHQLRPKICCDSYCEAFKCKQHSLWTWAAAMHRLWINDRRNACQRVYDDMCLRATDKPSGAYIALLPRTAGRCKNRIYTLILISPFSKQRFFRTLEKSVHRFCAILAKSSV